MASDRPETETRGPAQTPISRLDGRLLLRARLGPRAGATVAHAAERGRGVDGSAHPPSPRKGDAIARRLATWLLAALLGGAAFAGCGGASSAKDPAHAARRPWRTQLAAPAIAACRHAVAQASSLSEAERREIAAPCGRLDERVLENEETVHAVCQELASATSSSPDAAEAARVTARCYAGYVKTIPRSERLRGYGSHGSSGAGGIG